jgi:hypothetical protein
MMLENLDFSIPPTPGYSRFDLPGKRGMDAERLSLFTSIGD